MEQISHFQKPITETSIAEFDDVIIVNLRGSFICCKEFIEGNRGEDYGRNNKYSFY